MNGSIYEIKTARFTCVLSSLGASIVALRTIDRDGRLVDVALSPRAFYTDGQEPSNAGRTVGPCCGRVQGGLIEIDGAPVQLSRNEGENHLHGGFHGVAAQLWRACQPAPDRVRFELDLPDGLDGFPGNRRIRAEYAVSEDALRVIYSATTDRTTWLGLTNHVYWDLSGRFDGAALRQTLEIAADRVVHNGMGHLPQTVLLLDGPFEFASGPKALSGMMEDHAGHDQLLLGRGYNNAFLLNPALQQAKGFAARLASPLSGIRMTLQTDQPSIVLYSGGFLGPATTLKHGHAAPGCAVALEAQAVPDPFHLAGQAPEILRPGERYRREILWRFERF